MLAAWEWSQLAGFTSCLLRILLVTLYGFLLSLIMLILPLYFHAANFPLVGGLLWLSLPWWLATLILIVFYPNSARIWRNSHLIRLLFGLMSLASFFWGMLALRQFEYENNHFTGSWWLMYVMLLVWSLDSGAYIFGKIFGKHKLAPKVSPNKSWEGVAGGLMTSGLVALLFSNYAPVHTTPFSLLVCSLLSAFFSVLGDLTESMFKREAGVKNSGYLIPGHGGILDRIDSLIAAVPVFSWLMLLIF